MIYQFVEPSFIGFITIQSNLITKWLPKMKSITKIILTLIFAASATSLSAAELDGGVDIGYNNGPGWFLSGTASQFTHDVPISVRLGLGYSWVNPGNAAEARKIFINDATDGTPEKGGGIFNLRCDILFPIQFFGLPNSHIYLGPRFAHFVGSFKYVGGNEEFDVISNVWGVGLGLETAAAISQKTYLKLDLATDYFSPAALSGHDTSYVPDGDHVNSRKNFSYSDADKAINQPKYGLRLMIGLLIRLR
jgi:hypothetical protein